MKIGDLLLDDGDIETTRQVLHQMRAVLSTAANDYAKAAVGASSTAFENAMSGCTVAALFQNMHEAGEYSTKAQYAMSATFDCVNMILNLYGDDDEGREAYEEFLIAQLGADQIMALVEAAQTRIGLVYATLPEGQLSPFMRADPTRMNNVTGGSPDGG